MRPAGPGHDGDAVLPVDVVGVGPGFLDALQIALLAGRPLSAAEVAQAPSPEGVGAALVNEALARRLAPDGNALGRTLRYQGDQPGPTWQIVGVVRDAKYSDLRRAIQPTIYRASSGGGVSFEVRTRAEPTALVPAIRAAVGRLAPRLPLVDVKTQSDEIEQLLFREKLMARVSTLFAVLALGLASIGLYALLSYEVARRSREVGIRMALGAQRGDIRRMIVAQGLALTAAGIVLGLGAALAATRALDGLLYGVAPTDPLVLGGVSALFVAVAVLACYLPARRATRVDPMVVLRDDG
jgi:hypothetical protein